jgi:hypothetical protein
VNNPSRNSSSSAIPPYNDANSRCHNGTGAALEAGDGGKEHDRVEQRDDDGAHATDGQRRRDDRGDSVPVAGAADPAPQQRRTEADPGTEREAGEDCDRDEDRRLRHLRRGEQQRRRHPGRLQGDRLHRQDQRRDREGGGGPRAGSVRLRRHWRTICHEHFGIGPGGHE